MAAVPHAAAPAPGRYARNRTAGSRSARPPTPGRPTRRSARAGTDGADAKWTGTIPTGPGIWSGAPLLPGMGSWKTWVLESGSQLRPGPPPAFDSAQRAKELAEVKSYQRDSNPFSELFFWPQDPAGRPAPGAAPVSSNQIVFYYAPLL